MTTLFAAIFKSLSGTFRLFAIFSISASVFLALEVQAQNHQWVSVFSGASTVQSNSVAVDASGNVYTTGLFQGTADFDPGAGESTLTSSGSDDVFITKLNSSGGLVWAKKVGGTSSDKGLSIVVDASSNVYVSGTFGGIVDFDPGAGTSNMTATSATDLYVLKLDASGNYAWAKRWGSNQGVTPIGLAVDASGNVYTGGSFVNIVDLDPGAGTVNVNTGLSNVTHTFLVKLNASGNYVTGKRLGVTNYGIVNSSAMAMDASNNIILTGVFGNLNSGVNGTNVDFDPDAGVSELDAANGEYFIAKYNSSLSYVWAVHSPSVQNTTAMHIDGSGNLLVTGYFAGTKDFDPGVGETNLTPVGNEDAYVFKLNSLGEFQWAKNFGSTLSDNGYAVTSDAVGNVYVTGVFWGTTVNDFDPGPAVVALPTGTNGYDGFIVKLNASGDYQWAKSIFAPLVNGWDQVNGIFLDGSNNIYCTGFFTNGTVDFDPGAGTDNKTSTGSDAFVLKWSQSALIAQTITFNALAAKAMGDAPFALTATASSGLPVSYTSSNPGVATISGSTVTLVAPGTTTITAIQTGNGTYSPASNVNQLLTVTAAADVTPPSISFYSPSDNASNVAIGANLQATFSETVTAVASKVVSIKYAGGEVPGTIFESYTLPSANVTVSGNTVTINPTSNLANLAEYYVNIEAGAFIDAAGNPFAGISNATSWNFTAVPASAPIATAFYPVNNATNVPVGVNSFFIAFDDFIQANQSALGTVQLKKLDGTVVFETTAPNISTCCQNVPFYMGEAVLDPATTYYFNIGNDIFRKSGGVSYYTGIANNTAWRFTTGSVNSVISSYLPARGATSVSTSLGSIKMFFSSDVYDSYGYYRLRKASDNSLVKQWDVYADITYGYDAQAGLYFAELPLSAALEAGTTYYIDNQFNNAGGYEPGWMEYDFAYNQPEDIWTTARIVPWATNFWTFTTAAAADVTPPTITSLSPADNATGVAVNSNLVVTFSENIIANNGLVSIREVSGNALHSGYSVNSGVTISNNTLTITPSYDLTAGTEYYIDLDVELVRDAAGNTFAGLNGNPNWTFTTQNEQIAVQSYSPSNGSTDVPVSSNLSINFNENINIGSGTISFHYASTGATITSLSGFDGGTMSINGATITFDLPNDLPANSEIYINITSGYLRSAANAQKIWPGIQDNTSWRFTTGKLAQTITFAALPAKTFGNAPFALGATASSSLGVSYTSSNSAVATVSGNTVTIVGVGSTNITASQAGNATYNSAANVQQTLTVNKATQTISFAALPAKNFGDANFALGATASSSLPVSYSSSNAAVATVSGNTVTIIGVGSTNITASQAGNANYNAASSVQQTLTVNKASQTITFAALPAKTFGEAAFTLGATASSSLGVSYTSSNAAVATVSGNTVTVVGAGSTIITASQAGNANYSAASSVQQTLTVNKANQSITFGALPTKTFGDAAFTLGATASSSLAVSYASSNTSVATISGNTVTIVGAGNTTITASQAGNANYNAASTVQQTLTVNKANQTISITPIADKLVSAVPFAVSASTTSNLTLAYSINSGPASISGTTITLTGSSGTVEVAVSQAGNTNYNSASATASFFVSDPAKSNQTITFAALPAKAYGDASFSLGATASSGLSVSYTSSNLSVATISGSTVTITGVGSTNITASQAGNATFNAAPLVEQTLTVTKGGQSITFAALPAKTFGDANFTLGATASSSLAVSYTSSNTAVATVSGSTVTIVGAGTTAITASQAGNANYNAATGVPQTLTVNKVSQTITFAALADKTFGDATFALTASGGASGNGITFTSSNTAVATVIGSTVTIVGAGTTTITASQVGNANYNAATPVERSLTVTKKAQTITVASITNKLTTDAAFSAEATTDSGLELTYEVTGPATIAGATITLSGETGTVTVLVKQAGNANYLAAEASVSFEVTAPASAEKQAQTITFADVPNKTFGDAAFDLEASASSQLAVSFEVVSGPVTLSGNTVTITGAGSATIRATQAGNGAFNPAAAVEKSFVIAKKGQTVTLSAIANKLSSDPAFEISASVDSDLSLTFEVTGPASIAGTTLTLTGSAGTVTVKAMQAGNDNYLAAEASVSFEVTMPVPTTFSLSGSAVTSAGQAFGSGQANLYVKNKNGTFGAAIGSALSATGTFQFTGLEAGEYALGITSSVNSILTTYYVNALSLADATIINITTSNVGDLQIIMKNRPVALTGPGTIKGTLLEAANGGRTIVMNGRTMEGTPLAGVTIYLLSSPANELMATTVTAADGTFQFTSLPLGAYRLVVDYEGKTTIESPEIVLTQETLSFDVASEITEEGIVIVAEPATTTGVASNLLSQSLTAYPNPSMGVITIEWDGAVADVQQIIVHNNNGSAVWTGALVHGQQTIDISHHPKGVYFLRLVTSTGAAIQKLVIK